MSGPEGGGIDPDVALFAQWMRDEDRRERDAKRQARDARRVEETARALTAAKDAAAAEVKRLRSSPSATADQRAAADAAYRDALAAVVAAETGKTPPWAPAPAPDEPGPTPIEAATSPDADPSGVTGEPGDAIPGTGAETDTETATGAETDTDTGVAT